MTASSFQNWLDLGISLRVENVDRSLAFYRDVLGCEVLRDEEDPDQRLVSLRSGNALIDLVGGHRTSADTQAFRLFWVVEDMREAVGRLEAGGGRIIRHMEYGIYCEDPDGYQIMLVQKEPDPEDMSF